MRFWPAELTTHFPHINNIANQIERIDGNIIEEVEKVLKKGGEDSVNYKEME